ncbi:hypothetical protein Lfu02_40770 [Longispora fulva]|nr:hypothetical protein Lfu02_40770 [Longispora fulva]
MFVHFDDGRVSAVQLWRPEVADGEVRAMFDGIDIFGQLADTVMDQLRNRGIEIDLDDPWHPTCGGVTLGFDREGGDDCDDDGLARYFGSVLVAPPGYFG